MTLQASPSCSAGSHESSEVKAARDEARFSKASAAYVSERQYHTRSKKKHNTVSNSLLLTTCCVWIHPCAARCL